MLQYLALTLKDYGTADLRPGVTWLIASLLSSGSAQEFYHASLLLEMVDDTDSHLLAQAIAPIATPRLAPPVLLAAAGVGPQVAHVCLHTISRTLLHDPTSTELPPMRVVWALTRDVANPPHVRMKAMVCASKAFTVDWCPLQEILEALRGTLAALHMEPSRFSHINCIAIAAAAAVPLAAKNSNQGGLRRLLEELVSAFQACVLEEGLAQYKYFGQALPLLLPLPLPLTLTITGGCTMDQSVPPAFGYATL